MNRTEKAEMVEALAQRPRDSPPTRSSSPSRASRSRRSRSCAGRSAGTQSKYLVVKNTLALRATKGTPLEAVAEHFTGATAVAYNRSNPVALAKVLTTFAKTNPNLVFKGALIEGQAVAAAEIKAIAELPSREELVSKLLFLMQSPMRRLVTVLNGPVRNLAGRHGARSRSRSRNRAAADAAPAN